MSPAAVLVALAAAAAVALALPPAPPRPPGGRESRDPPGRRAGGGPEPEDPLRRFRPALSLTAGVLPYVVLGGWVGMLAGPVAALLAWRVLGAMEPGGRRRRRERLEAQLPHAVDLLAATLAAGAAPAQALSRVAAAVEPPLRDELTRVEHALAVGREPALVWREVSRDPALGPLGRCLVRATETGTSVADAMRALAGDLRRAQRGRAESLARSVGVRAAAPLGICLLPAFVLVGVVPLVVGSVSAFLAP